MSRFNVRTAKPSGLSPVTTTGEHTRTHEGATGHLREPKSELFLLAVSNMVGQNTFYEQAGQRDDRYEHLVRTLAAEDPEWTAGLLAWLRNGANMRTAALVGAAEFTAARLQAKLPGYSRQVIGSVLRRADEPGEFLAYWTSQHGRAIPKPVKRGIEDAIGELYTERALLKYDTASKGYRFGDVIELVHPKPKALWQGDLFEHAIDRRHNRDNPIPESLQTLHARAGLASMTAEERRELVRRRDADVILRDAGMTWEALAGWLQGPMDAAAWQAVIPSMGVFALVRNLRNFDEAGVPDEIAEQVTAKISDRDVVASSRMFPFRFWAAYKHTSSLRWAHALDKAINLSLGNVPALDGRTLILVDRSPSMFPGFGFSTANASDIPLAEQAAVFGAALAVRAADPTLVEFGATSRRMDVPRGGSVLRLVEQFGQIGGTDIPSAVKQHYAGHDRVLIVTDEQTRAGWLPSNCRGYHGGMPETRIDDLIPKTVPVYMWNMAGYRAGAMQSGGGNRHTLGGLTDAAFRAVPLLEAGRNAAWPWEQQG